MTAMLCWNKVRDFGRWKRIFDAHAADHEQAGLTLTHIWREVEDPSEVYMLFDVKDINKARAFMTSPYVPKEQEEAGIIDGPDVHFLEGGRPMH